MRLEYHGDTVSASLVGGRRQRGVYERLFWALQRGLGQTLAEIENLEVAP